MSKIVPRTKAMQDAGGFESALDGVQLRPTMYAIPKQPVYRNKALLDAVRSIPCAHCGAPAQAAHSNQSRHGKGKGRKASDAAIAALCQAEHHEIDNGKKYSKQERREKMDVYIVMTYGKLLSYGLIEMSAKMLNLESYACGSVADSLINAMESGEIKLI